MSEPDDREARGFRTIGSLMPQTPPMPWDAGCQTPTTSDRHSPTTGTRKMARKPSNGIGTQLSELGADERRLAITRLVSTAPAGTLARDPAALLPQSLTSSLEGVWADGVVDDFGWDGQVIRYEMIREPPAADMALAIQIAEAIQEPASEREVLAELTRVRVLTVSRDQGTADIELLMAAYADELKRYPADVMREVLRDWPRHSRFWPSLAELTERLDRMMKPRRALAKPLRRGYRPPEYSPDWIPPNPEDKAAVRAKLAEFGYGIDDAGRAHPLEQEPPRAEILRQVAEETKRFRLPDEDDPRVQARLREMGEAT